MSIQAMQLALEALEIAMKTPINEYLPRECLDAIDALRAALAEEKNENTVQSTGGVHSRVSDGADRNVEAVTDCHDLEQARAVAISNLLAHFGITSANSDVNAVYLHKLLGDFLTAAIGCNKERGNLPPPLDSEECGYPNCLSTNGCEKQCPAFPRIPDADTGKTSDVPETNFGDMSQVFDSAEADHIPDAGKMVASVREDRTVEATSRESRQVEPVGYFSINSYGNWEQNENDTGEPFYAAPPKRKPLNTDLILARWANECVSNRSTPELVVAFARAIEQEHGIGGEE